MDLPTKEIRQLEPSIPRSVTLAALASFHARFNHDANFARVIGRSSETKATKPDKSGYITVTSESHKKLGYSFGADRKKEFCDLDNTIGPSDVCSQVQNAGLDDVVMQQIVIVRAIKDLPLEVSDLLETKGIERIATMETNHGFKRNLLGIHCASPTAILGGALASIDPDRKYDIMRLSRRAKGILMLDAVILDTGKKFMNWCDLRPDYFTHKMLIDAWSKPFYMDMALPKRISMEDSNIKGILFWLNKYGMPIGCR